MFDVPFPPSSTLHRTVTAAAGYTKLSGCSRSKSRPAVRHILHAVQHHLGLAAAGKWNVGRSGWWRESDPHRARAEWALPLPSQGPEYKQPDTLGHYCRHAHIRLVKCFDLLCIWDESEIFTIIRMFMPKWMNSISGDMFYFFLIFSQLSHSVADLMPILILFLSVVTKTSTAGWILLLKIQT